MRRGTSSPCWEGKPPIPDLAELFVVSIIQDLIVLSDGITEKEIGFFQCDMGVGLEQPMGYNLSEGQHIRVVDP